MVVRTRSSGHDGRNATDYRSCDRICAVPSSSSWSALSWLAEMATSAAQQQQISKNTMKMPPRMYQVRRLPDDGGGGGGAAVVHVGCAGGV